MSNSTNPLETFNYDPVGNRTNSNQNGASSFNQANELLEDANFNYQYDNNGNMIRKTAKVGGDVTQYEGDGEGMGSNDYKLDDGERMLLSFAHGPPSEAFLGRGWGQT